MLKHYILNEHQIYPIPDVVKISGGHNKFFFSKSELMEASMVLLLGFALKIYSNMKWRDSEQHFKLAMQEKDLI